MYKDNKNIFGGISCRINRCQNMANKYWLMSP